MDTSRKIMPLRGPTCKIARFQAGLKFPSWTECGNISKTDKCWQNLFPRNLPLFCSWNRVCWVWNNCSLMGRIPSHPKLRTILIPSPPKLRAILFLFRADLQVRSTTFSRQFLDSFNWGINSKKRLDFASSFTPFYIVLH